MLGISCKHRHHTTLQETILRKAWLQNIVALIIRIGFGGPVYDNYKDNYNKEPPK